MKRLKKVFALLLALLTAGSLASCRGGPAAKKETVTLKLWGAPEDKALLTELSEGFKKKNPQKAYTIVFEAVGEADAKTAFLKAPSTAADVFAFPNDQIRDFTAAKALLEITANAEKVKGANMAGAVEAATVDGKLYACPAAMTNGCFLYYDKSVVSAAQATTLDGLLAAANKAGKKVLMNVSNAWYLSAFFLGAGCKLGVGADGKKVCDFNSAAGVKTGEAIQKFTADKAFMTGGDADIIAKMGDQLAACVSGAWNAETIKEKLGSNFAAAKLPSFSAGGGEKQMVSFASYSLIGVNKNTKHPADAMALADWLTNEQSQLKRFEKRSLVPTNREAVSSEAVRSDPALGALAAQGEFALPQKDIPVTYWGPAAAFGKAMEEQNGKRPVKDLLDDMVAQILS